MVVLLDLDEDAADDPFLEEHYRRQLHPDTDAIAGLDVPVETFIQDRLNPNIGGFSAALACYPVVSNIAQYLDLNSLHDLSATCRQIHANLLQFRDQLVKQTLHCVNEPVEISTKLADGLRHAAGLLGGRSARGWTGRMTSGRVSRCARDLVGECRRCGTVVCRNCTIKHPPPSALQGRYRRICRTCTKYPLYYHTASPDSPNPPAFTTSAFSRGHCNCTDTVYLCLSCGNAIRSADTTYMRGWTWRTRYSTYLGGMGTGIGEGNEGVECGRGPDCFAAKEVEKEIDCDADELAELRREMERVEMERGGSWSGTSYLTQEMEGIGGVRKKKVKKRIMIGSVVKEYEDERETGIYLEREQEGVNRSWCFWCLRVVPSNNDCGLEGDGDLSESPSSSPSSRKSC